MRGGRKHVDQSIDPIIEPIYQTAMFGLPDVETKPSLHGVAPLKYSREDNPTVHSVEVKMAKLEYGYDALGFNSGMAALSTVILALSRPGFSIAVPLDVYGSTLVLLRLLEKFGVRPVITDPGTKGVLRAIEEGVDAVLVESVSNPLLRVYDVEALAKAAHEKNAILIVDNTLATPIGMNPLRLGADIVVHSATKYLSGHNDVVAGFIVTRDLDLARLFWEWRRVLGSIMDPHVAFLVDRGLKTLHVRMRRHEENARAIAEFLLEHPKVERVYYPCLDMHETSDVAKRLLRNCGGIVSFEVKGGADEALRVYKSVRLITPGVSFGGVESIITHPASTTHAHWSKEERLRAGIRDNLLRLSVGLEDVEDLIEDLDQALRQIP